MEARDCADLVTGFPWWVIAVLVVVFVYRREIREFLTNAKSVTVGPVSLERELETAEDAERQSESAPTHATSPPPPARPSTVAPDALGLDAPTIRAARC